MLLELSSCLRLQRRRWLVSFHPVPDGSRIRVEVEVLLQATPQIGNICIALEIDFLVFSRFSIVVSINTLSSARPLPSMLI